MPSPSTARALPRWAYGWAVLAVVLALVYLLRGVLSPVLIAFGLAYLLDPLVDRLEAHKLPRSVGILILLLIAALLIGLASLLVLPQVLGDMAELAGQLPVAAAHALSQIEPWLAERGVPLPHSSVEMLQAFENNMRSLAPEAAGTVQTVIGALVGGTASVFGALAGIVLVPVLAFYLLKDFDIITAHALALVPARERDRVASTAREVDEVLGHFLRGQLTVMAILAALYAGGYSAIGVPLAVPIGVVAGLLSFIPYVGSGVALGLGVLMVVLHWSGWGPLVGVLIVYACVQTAEGLVITPRIVGDKLGLSPVWVLLALMAGGELFGFVGVMLALPAAAVAKVFAMHALNRYQASTLYTQRNTLPPPEPRPLRRLRAVRRLRRVRGDGGGAPATPETP
jgi:predicted PurR-regulated permease PerM